VLYCAADVVWLCVLLCCIVCVCLCLCVLVEMVVLALCNGGVGTGIQDMTYMKQ